MANNFTPLPNFQTGGQTTPVRLSTNQNSGMFDHLFGDFKNTLTELFYNKDRKVPEQYLTTKDYGQPNFDKVISTQLQQGEDRFLSPLNKFDFVKQVKDNLVTAQSSPVTRVRPEEMILQKKIRDSISARYFAPHPERVRARDFVREMPDASKEVAKMIGQSITRSFFAVSAAIVAGDIDGSFTPETELQKKMTGTDKPISFKSIGGEVVGIVGKKEEDVDERFLIPLGMMFAGLDVVPGWGSTSKQSLNVSSRLIAKMDDSKLIFKELRTIFQGPASEVKSLADGLVKVNDPRKVQAMLTGVLQDIKPPFIKDLKPTESAEKFIANVRTSKLPEEAVKELEKLVKQTSTKIEKTHVSLKEIDTMAKDGDWDGIMQQIINLPEGGLAAGVRSKAVDQFVATLMNENATLAQKLQATLVRNRLAPETGRAVTQFRLPFDQAQELLQLFDKQIKSSPPGSVQRRAWEQIKDLSGVTNDVPTLWSKIIEAATNFKLTSHRTYIRNTVGNTIARLYRPAEKGLAGFANLTEKKIRDVIPGATKIQQERFMREALFDTYGFAKGLGEAVTLFYRSILDENLARKSFRVMELTRERGGGAISGVTGKAIRLPFRLLGATDEMFKAMNRYSEVHSLAFRTAKMEGLEGTALWKRIEELIHNPTPEISRLTEEATLESVFQKPLGEIMKKAENFLNAEWNPLKIVVPFFRTPVNLFEFAWQRGATGFLSKRNLTELFKGPGLRAESTARLMIGSMTGAYLTWLAVEGYITGRGPENDGERALLRSTGWQPFSIRYEQDGEIKYRSYTGFEPLSSHLALGAAIAEEWQADPEKDVTERVENFVKTITGNLKEQPYVAGIRDLFNFLEDPNAFSFFLQQTAAGLVVPTGLKVIEELADPIKRETSNVLEAIQARVPGLSKQLPPQRDILGRPIEDDRSLFGRLSPSMVTTENINQVQQELLDLGLTISVPDRKIDGIRLTAEERSELMRSVGTAIHGSVFVVVNSEGYGELSKEQRKSLLGRLISNEFITAQRNQIRMNAWLRDLGFDDLSIEDKRLLFLPMAEVIKLDIWDDDNEQTTKAQKRIIIQELINNLSTLPQFINP